MSYSPRGGRGSPRGGRGGGFGGGRGGGGFSRAPEIPDTVIGLFF